MGLEWVCVAFTTRRCLFYSQGSFYFILYISLKRMAIGKVDGRGFGVLFYVSFFVYSSLFWHVCLRDGVGWDKTIYRGNVFLDLDLWYKVFYIIRTWGFELGGWSRWLVHENDAEQGDNSMSQHLLFLVYIWQYLCCIMEQV